MNCNEAKKISIVSILEKIGAKKVKQTNKEIWYLSPFRDETTASFKIDIKKNVFYDHGEGLGEGVGGGGNVLDFVMKYYKCDLKGALQVLDKNFSSFSFHQPTLINSASEKENKYEIQSVSSIKNKNLIDYINSRGLCLKTTQKYCCEVHYILNGKTYYGIGFKNDLDGFEIRNKYVKMCLNRKCFTTIINNQNIIVVFEGWSDFISFLTLYPKQELTNDFLILNSVSQINNIESILNKYKNITMFFDNDDAGASSSQKIKNAFPFAKDYSNLYQGFKDLNEFLVANEKICFDNFLSRGVSVDTKTEVFIPTRETTLAFTPEKECRKRDDEGNKKQFHSRRKRR